MKLKERISGVARRDAACYFADCPNRKITSSVPFGLQSGKKETIMKKLITILLTVTALNFSLIPYISAEGPKGKTKAAKDTRTESAKKVMKNVRQLANVIEEGGHLVVEFHEYLFPYDINKRLQFVRAVADADCVLTGKPRLIFYYNPDGKQIAQADPSNGIKLK